MKDQLNYFISRYQGACLSLWQEQIPINKHDIKNQSVACDSCDRQFPTEIFPHAKKNLEACAPNTMRSRTEVSADIFRTSLRNMIEHDELISCLTPLNMRWVKKYGKLAVYFNNLTYCVPTWACADIEWRLFSDLGSLIMCVTASMLHSC